MKKLFPFYSATFLCVMLLTVSAAISTGAAVIQQPPQLSVSFDGNLNGITPGGKLNGHFDGAPDQLQFAAGISGQGMLTGGTKQSAHFDLPGNTLADQWTSTFWVKALSADAKPAEGWQTSLWTLYGEKNQGSLRFYRINSPKPTWQLSLLYQSRVYPLLAIVPDYDAARWHQWAISWSRESGARIYVDGRLVASDAQFGKPNPVMSKYIVNGKMVSWDWAAAMPNPPSQLIAGQISGTAAGPRRIIDNLQFYQGVLGASQIARQFYQEDDANLQPEITVAPASQKINIDGKIEASEWQNAARFTSLPDTKTDQVEAPQTWGRITCDDHNLYLAMHSPMPDEVRNNPENTVNSGFLQTSITRHDGDVEQDDSFVWLLSPPGQPQFVYRIAANSLGVIRDERRDGGQTDLAWDSHAEVKSISNLQGWTMEMAIPLTSFGISQIANGANWKMNFGRHWKQLRQRTDQWAIGGSNAPAAMGEVHFSQHPPAVASLQNFTISPTGQAEATVELHNPGASAVTATMTLSAGGQQLARQSISLGGGQSQTENVTSDVSKYNGALAELAIDAGNISLLRQSLPVLLQQSTHLTLWKYPSRQQIRLGWLIGDSQVNPADLTLQARVENTSGKVLLTSKMDHLPKPQGSMLLDVKSIPDGNYKVLVSISNKQGTAQQQTFDYQKQPLPEWLGNTLGLSDTPPPPWTDVKVAEGKDSISFWGRDYEYQKKLLPVQIINHGNAMLAGPMQLDVVAGAANLNSDASEADTVKWTKTSATRADSLRQQKLGAINLKADSYVEFDGFTWMTLTVSPAAKEAHLRSLTFNIPLKAAWSKLINTYDYSLRETGLLPEDGWHGNARPVWVGNGDGGIQVFQETAATWIGSQTMDVDRDKNGQATIRLHLIDKQTTLDKPLTFAFGWMASPVRPAPQKHRDWRFLGSAIPRALPDGMDWVYAKEAHQAHADLRFFQPWWQGWWWIAGHANYQGNPDATGTLPVAQGPVQTAIEGPGGVVVDTAPYGRLAEIGTDNPWFAQFGDEWLPDVNEVYIPDSSLAPALRKTAVSQSARSLRDFFAWEYNQLLQKNNIHALYFDVSGVRADNNIYHGAGIPQAEGPPLAEENILGTRLVLRRIYTLLKAKDPNAILIYHASGRMLLPMASFCDEFADGENLQVPMAKTHLGYTHYLSIDQFRAQLSAQNNFGPATLLLPEFKARTVGGADYWKQHGYGEARYLLGLCLLHDTDFWWSYFPHTILKQVYSSLENTGWNSNWKFVPYWDQKYFSLPQGVYASIYQSPDGGKVLLVLMNTSGKDQDINLPMTLDKSTFKMVKAVDPDEQINVQDGQTSALQIPNNNFRVVVLEK